MPTAAANQKPSSQSHSQCCHSGKNHGRDSFSKASDYLYAISPVYLGAGYFLLRDYFSTKVSVPEIIYSGSIKANYGIDPAIYAHLSVFLLIMLGVTTGIGLIHMVNCLEDNDKAFR